MRYCAQSGKAGFVRPMEFILVNSVKLKIMLSSQDMKEFGLSGNAPEDSGFSRTALRRLLDRAHTETGFDTKHAKIYVQAFPAPDGSCELFLTRRSRILPEPEEEKSVFRKKYRFSGDDRGRKEYIAVSKEIDDLADLCVRMHKGDFRGESALYMLDDYYYLWICFPRRLPSFIQNAENFPDDEADRFSYLGEYADVVFADRMTFARLSEHGKNLISEKAVETLWGAFSGT